MASGKKDSRPYNSGNFRKIWSQTKLEEWLAFLQEHRPELNWEVHGKEIRGLCPYHEEKTPSFRLAPERGFGVCFGASCPQKFVGNAIKFISDISGENWTKSISILRKQFGVRTTGIDQNLMQQIEDNEELKQNLLHITNSELVDALDNPDDPAFEYIKKSGLIPWLRQRNFPIETAHTWPIGVLPTRRRLRDILTTCGMSGLCARMEMYLADYLSSDEANMLHEGSLLAFYFLTPKTVGRIKLRIPRSDTFYYIDDPVSDEIGYFGLNMYSHLIGRVAEMPPLYVVEGEMDALALISHQRATGTDDICAIATGGKAVHNLDDATSFGFSEIYLVPDNDRPGVGWATGLLAENKNVTRVFTWSPDLDLNVKDPDDAVREYGYAGFSGRLIDESNLLMLHDWAFRHASAEMEKIDPNDLRELAEKAASFGKALHAESERSAFAEEVESRFNVKKEDLLREMVPDDSPEAFVLRISRFLEKEYRMMAQRQYGMRPGLTFWSNRKHVVRTFVTDSPGQIRGTLELDLGLLEEYLKNDVGVPEFLEYMTDARGRKVPVSETYKSKMVTHYFAQAVGLLAQKLLPTEQLTEVGQGLHCVREEGRAPTIYVVNGNRFFKVTPGDKTEYEEIKSPVCDNFLFRLAGRPWSLNLRTVEDFSDAIRYDVKELFDKIYDMIGTAWKFQHQQLDAMFLTADILYTPIASVFGFMVLTDVFGESQSGKSTFMKFIGGSEFQEYRLCEATQYVDDFSAASIRQVMSNMRLRLFIDEFEQSDFSGQQSGTKSGAVRGVLELIRSLSTGATSTRGTPEGNAQTYNLHFPLTIGGMYTMRETRDLNRFVHVRTKYVKGKQDPISVIERKYSREEIADIRRGITLCWFPRLHEIMKLYDEICEEYADNSNLPAGMQGRLKRNLLPAATILKYVGHDYRSFMMDYSKVKLEGMDELGAGQESATIWHHILHTPFPAHWLGDDERGMTTVMRVVMDPFKRPSLNTSDIGVYYIEDYRWLVVFWYKALAGILKSSPLYKDSRYPGRLKIIADEDARTARKNRYVGNDFMQRYIWTMLGSNVSSNDISVIEVDKLGVLQQEAVENDAKTRAAVIDDIPEELIARGVFDDKK